MESTKAQVIRSFLMFLAQYVPVGQARLATLGGRGLEEKIWSELGIPFGHGWLIERSRKLGGKLIANHRYQTHNQLGTFSRILAGHGADRAFIDGFHLDLCGTLCDDSIANFAPVVPLILSSSGRCLAITVADARRNLALEQWPDFQERAAKLFGRGASEDIYYRIEAYQKRVPIRKDQPAFIKPFDPTKGAQREFGLLVELTELLHRQKLPWIPVAVERYVYVSRYQRRPFRMRSYFFRFGEQAAKSSELAFANAWITSKLSFANGDAFREVKAPSILGIPITAPVTPIGQQPTTKGETVMTDRPSRLKELVGVLGGAEEAEYNQLLTDSLQLRKFHELLTGSKGSTEGIAEPNSASPPTPDAPPQRRRRAKKTWEDLTDAEQIQWQLKALELKAEMGGHWKNGAWEKLLKQDFGYYNSELGGSLRAALARTNGGFRKMFETRIKTVFGDQAKQYIDRLAKL